LSENKVIPLAASFFPNGDAESFAEATTTMLV
jgi:hypothetical protein